MLCFVLGFAASVVDLVILRSSSRCFGSSRSSSLCGGFAVGFLRVCCSAGQKCILGVLSGIDVCLLYCRRVTAQIRPAGRVVVVQQTFESLAFRLKKKGATSLIQYLVLWPCLVG